MTDTFCKLLASEVLRNMHLCTVTVQFLQRSDRNEIFSKLVQHQGSQCYYEELDCNFRDTVKKLKKGYIKVAYGRRLGYRKYLFLSRHSSILTIRNGDLF